MQDGEYKADREWEFLSDLKNKYKQMKHCISKPSLLLSKFVKHYWTIENCIPKGEEHIQRIIPHGLLELIFYLDDKPISADGNKTFNENTLITGQLSKYYDIKISGRLSLFSIIFQPYGLSVFLDIPLNELYNRNVPLRFIIKDNIDELEAKLFEAKSFQERLMIAERFLLELLQKNKQKYNFERIKESIGLINQSKGLANIDLLASKACFSRRQYERIFSDFIGTSPKQFFKIIRFQNAINEKSKNINANLTTLTYQCGYYDQSHMTNDFYKLSGMSPKQFFNESEPHSDYFQ